MRKVTRLVYGFFLVLLMQPVFAARPLGPPVEELLRRPETAPVVAAIASDKADPPWIKFLVSERFSGESPDQLILRVDEDTFSNVKVGESYVLAWTELRLAPLLRDGYEQDPEGASIIKIRGLETKAIFQDSIDIRFLLTSREPSGDTGPETDALLALMLSDDPNSEDLAAAQFLLKPKLTGNINSSQVEGFQKVLDRPALGAQNRNFLLQSALRMPADLSSPWLAEEYRKVIIFNGTQYDLLSHVPGLVMNSVRGLGVVGERQDIGLLNVLLYANHPGVAEAALKSMDKFDPEATRIAAERALDRGWIIKTTRLTLDRYLGD